ncbi:mediator complex subunit Med5-domain-containing protein [Dichomitus squalens]|uniref:Mediator of RNA polymerase II transcription subunit 5 n=1 Tax=Dichomitus squalens TaxID=114155 RepID=A0A4Q9P643_9APHY|nr:mediator complex subunit Med5-domain-containing protein [Dichomitus squalens]TBU62013.1 mediator complex subunit Med5-domain-containing protein [Dichomitus squalens]
MSLAELTRNAFQSGITARKWLALCKLFISKNLSHNAAHSIETEISNSVLVLFRDYPGDPTLQGYLKEAIQDGVLSLPIFLTAFLQAAQSANLHNPATLDMLCRVVLDHHYASGMPTMGSLVPFGEPTTRLLSTVQYAMGLLRTAFMLPVSHFHQLTTSASELLVLLLSCVTDTSQISAAQAMLYLAEANDLLQNVRLHAELRPVLETFAFSLSMLVPDDPNQAREAQMMHTLQFALGRGETVLSASSETDIVACSLILNHLIFCRASDFGSGDGPHAVAIFVGLLRGSSWAPWMFYAQLIISSLTCLAQSISPTGPTRASAIWRAFTIGRLPHLLAAFRKAGRPEAISESEWHSALQIALPHVLQRVDLLEKVDNNGQPGGSDAGSDKSVVQHSFISEFLYQLLSVGVVEQAVVATINPNLSNDFHPRVATEAQEMGVDLPGYFEAKLCPEATPEDIEVLLYRAWKDPCCHAAFAEVVVKRFTTSTKNLDAESLGLVCKMLSKHEMALDMLSLHAKISDLVAHALAFIEDYDCETVGDPQTAVSHLGDVVLFVETTIVRFNLASLSFKVGERVINPDYMRTAGLQLRPGDLKGDEMPAFSSWTKALFDPGSEGIEDTILRTTRPKTLLKITPSLFSFAIAQAMDRKMDKEVLNNGISYFLGPLLNWTLAGVIRSLLMDIQRRSYNAPVHLEVLKTLLTSSSCPPTVLTLSAPSVLRLFPDPFPQHSKRYLQDFDPKPVRQAARQALGLPAEEVPNPMPMDPSTTQWSSQSRQLIANALSAARSGRAPALDIDRCLLLCPPTKFLGALWTQLLLAATMADMEAPRRLATFVLTVPRSPRLPPLLPIFLHMVLPSLVASADGMSGTEQTITVELLVAVISSSLTAALHLEWALLTTCGEERFVLGQSVTSMARRLSADLKRRGAGTTAGMILQRLTAMQPFVANFPSFAAEV